MKPRGTPFFRHPILSAWPLRYTVPAVLLLFTSLAAGWFYYSDVQMADQWINQDQVTDITLEASALQRTSEYFFSKNALEQVQQELAEKAADPTMFTALVVDDAGLIVASKNRLIIGQRLADALLAVSFAEHGLSMELMAQVESSQIGKVFVSPNGKSVFAVYSVQLGVKPGHLRPDRVGALVLAKDLNGRKAIFRNRAKLQVLAYLSPIVALALAIFLCAHFAVNRRVARLIGAARRFAAGNMEARAGLLGGDEISEIGEAFDQMAARVSESQADLAESEARFQAFFSQGQMVAWAKDQEFRYRYINPAFEEMIGLPAASILGRTDFDLFPKPVADQLRSNDSAVLKSGGRIESIERVPTPDGRLRQWLAQKFVLRQPGKPPWIAGTATDLTARIEAEAAIAESEAVLAGMFAGIRDGILVADVETHRFTRANQAICRMLGYTLDEILKLGVEQIHPPESLPEVLADFNQKVTTNQGGLAELPMLRKDGSVFYVDITAQRITLAGRSYAVGAFRDVTERRLTEKRRNVVHAVTRILADAESLSEAIPKILQTVCFGEGFEFGELWNIDSAGQRLVCFETWHPDDPKFNRLERETRQSRFKRSEGLPGRVWAADDLVFVTTLDRNAGYPRAEAAAEAGLYSGLGIPIRVGREIIGVMVFLFAQGKCVEDDVSEMLKTIGVQMGQFIARKRAEEDLRRFVARSPSVIYALRYTPAGLRAYWVSENLSSLTGYSPTDDVHGSWWSDHIHPDDRDRVLALSKPPFIQDHIVLEYRFRHRDGSYFWLRDEKRVLRDHEGILAEIIGAWTNISERVALEKQLRQAQKMEAIGLLSGGIAHDFNNFLGVIQGNAELAALDLDAGHPAGESITQILTASRRAAHLVQQIMTFSRREQTERRPANIVAVVEESIRLLRATLPAGVKLSLIKGQGIPLILADETQIQQVLINLGTNSWHAFEGRAGEISLEVATTVVDEGLVARCPELRLGKYVRISVSDNGKGMPPAILERIFEPFFTTKEVGKGTGLGLSVVHGIIKSHDGAIYVQSTEGVGTTFDLFLPAIGGQVGELERDASPITPGQGEHLLLVDDQTEVLGSSRRLLERLGYRVTACPGATEALSLFRANPAGYQLVLTDFNMPGINGVELARIILRERPGTPILITSGFITEELRKEALVLGVHNLLRKPASLRELSEAVCRLLQSGTHDSIT